MKRWRTLYFIVANTAILLVVIEVGTHLLLKSYDGLVVPRLRPGLSEAAQSNYSHMPEGDVRELLAAFDAQRWRYEPVVGFVEAETASRFLNVDQHGIRQNQAARRPIADIQDAVWFFGGSTTFGEGVADAETIPAQLEKALGRKVVNFGVRNYESLEENVLLNHYLRIGFKPALVVFLDGINETCGPTLYQAEMATLVDMAQRGSTIEIGRPVTQAYARLRRKVRHSLGGTESPQMQPLLCEKNGRRNPLGALVTQRLTERSALCRLYGVECRTLVQPFAGVHGPRHGFDAAFLAGPEATELRALYDHLEPVWRTAGAIFLTHVFDQSGRHPFIDDVHYSAEASRIIAEAIASRLAPLHAPQSPQ